MLSTFGGHRPLTPPSPPPASALPDGTTVNDDIQILFSEQYSGIWDEVGVTLLDISF